MAGRCSSPTSSSRSAWAASAAGRAAPGSGRSAGQVVRLAAGALATSSIMCRQWRRGGRTLHHIVDPRTGLPAAGPWRTVSVAAANCAEANAASTAAIVAGDQAPAWLAGQGLPARLVARDGSVRFVAGWPEDDGGPVEAPWICRMSAGAGRPPRRRGPAAAAGHGGRCDERGCGDGLAIPVVPLPRQRPGPAGPVQRRGRARRGDPDRLGARPLAALRGRRTAPDALAVRGRPAGRCTWSRRSSIRSSRSAGPRPCCPFASPYRTLAIGLGALAVDLGGAVLVTSLMRRRLGQRAWRAVHWLAYLAWPAAFLHSLTAGNDLGIWWVALIEVGSAAAVAAAVLARLFSRSQGGPGEPPSGPPRPRPEAARLASARSAAECP